MTLNTQSISSSTVSFSQIKRFFHLRNVMSHCCEIVFFYLLTFIKQVLIYLSISLSVCILYLCMRIFEKPAKTNPFLILTIHLKRESRERFKRANYKPTDTGRIDLVYKIRLCVLFFTLKNNV